MNIYSEYARKKYKRRAAKVATRLKLLPLRIILVLLQLGETVAVGDCIQLLAGLAHGALGRIIGDVAGEILGSKQGINRDSVNGLSGGEHGGNSLNRSAVIGNALQSTGDGLAGLHSGDQQQNIFSRQHGTEVLTEEDLTGVVDLGGNDVDVLVLVHAKAILLCQMTGKERADHLTAIHTDNGVDGGDIAVTLRDGHSRLTSHHMFVLHLGDVDEVAVMSVAGCEMTFVHGDFQFGAEFRSNNLRVHV